MNQDDRVPVSAKTIINEVKRVCHKGFWDSSTKKRSMTQGLREPVSLDILFHFGLRGASTKDRKKVSGVNELNFDILFTFQKIRSVVIPVQHIFIPGPSMKSP